GLAASATCTTEAIGALGSLRRMSGPEQPAGAVQRVAVFSMHTSPLAQPGAGGGMNVYVRALASARARAGVACDVYTRAEDPAQQPVVEVEPGFRVVHV